MKELSDEKENQLNKQLENMEINAEDCPDQVDDDDDNNDDDDDNDEDDDDESNNEEDVEGTEEKSRETSHEEHLDFVYEADNFVRKKDKEG